MATAIMAFVAIATAMISAGVAIYQADQQEEVQKNQEELAQQSIDQQTNIANQNFGLEKEQFEYQKQLNELQMQREDTAIQRQVADLKAAGLSPLMASGGASTGQLISGNAPHLDGNGIMSAMSNLLGVRQDYAQRKQQAYQFQRQMSLQTAQQFADLTSLKLQNQETRERIKAQKIANKYNEEHGLRDPSATQALIDLAMKYYDDKGSIGGVIEGFKNNAPSVLNQGKEVVSDLIKEAAKEKLDQTIELGQKVKDLGSNIVENVPETIKEKVSSTYNKVKDSKVGRYVAQKYNQAKNSKASKWITQQYNKAKNWLGR